MTNDVKTVLLKCLGKKNETEKFIERGFRGVWGVWSNCVYAKIEVNIQYFYSLVGMKIRIVWGASIKSKVDRHTMLQTSPNPLSY